MTETAAQNRRLGYARVSTYGQTLDAQLDQLRRAGCSRIYREKATGAPIRERCFATFGQARVRSPMRRIAILACASILLFSSASIFSAHAENAETPPLEFAKLYIDQLAATEGIRDAAAKELTTDPDTQRLADCVHTMTGYQLELSTQSSAMQGVHLGNRFDWLPKGIADFDKRKLDIYAQYGDACATMLAGPKPNVDYGKIAASLAKMRAQLEFLDQGIFKTAPAVFATLIQTTKANSHGGLDHLIITKAERDALVQQIKRAFGDKISQHDQNWIVSAASVLEFYLEKKGYKCSDEPWD